jgi:hypothetical protein
MTPSFSSGHAVNALQQKFAIPAYFKSDATGDHDWSEAVTKPLLGMVVINPASGPGYTPAYVGGTKQHEYQTRIEQMRTVGANVVGYVTTNYRDSRPATNTVQREHRFTVDPMTKVVTTRNSLGSVNATGWTTGFGPIQVRSDSTLPGGLAVSTNYFWIAESETTGRFATSKTDATNGTAINLDPDDDQDESTTDHAMGLSRTLANIENVFFEIDQYYERYEGIDGIFFDEMNNVGDGPDLNYYKQIFDYVKAKGGKALVVENPGQIFPESMVDLADVFMTFESPNSGYAGYDPSWQLNYPAGKFWHAIYACPADDMPGIIAASRSKSAGYIYVTDMGDPMNPDPEKRDPWEHIASYFLDEKNEVQDRNTPPAVLVGRTH